MGEEKSRIPALQGRSGVFFFFFHSPLGTCHLRKKKVVNLGGCDSIERNNFQLQDQEPTAIAFSVIFHASTMGHPCSAAAIRITSSWPSAQCGMYTSV